MVKAPRPAPRIPPTQLVDRSYTAYTETPCLPNPTNAVGGSFIHSLHRDALPPESHQRSWWIVHTQPTQRLAETLSPARSATLRTFRRRLTAARVDLSLLR